MPFFRRKLVLKMSLFSICVILFYCLFYFSYGFATPGGIYRYMKGDTVFEYISYIDAQMIIDHLVKAIPEKVRYSSGPTFDVPLNQFDIRLDMYTCSLKLRGHFTGAKIWDTFAEVTIGSAKVYIKDIFGNDILTRQISAYVEENLQRIISANRNLVSNAVSQWAERGINNLLKKIDSNNIGKH
nr:unnamed protein product [Callosobruchus analis]